MVKMCAPLVWFQLDLTSHEITLQMRLLQIGTNMANMHPFHEVLIRLVDT